MKTVLKVVLVLALLCVGFVVVVAVGFSGILGGEEKAEITQADYQSVKTGTNGNTQERLVSRFGLPESQESECIYYSREGEDSLYEFCINEQTGRVESKSSR